MTRKLTLSAVSIILLASPALALAAASTCPTLTHTLSRGSKGAEVTALQKFLIARGVLASDTGTGYFGALTQGAVQKFQSSQGLVSSGTPSTTGYGLVGKKTRAAIGLACTRVTSSPTTYTPKSAPPSTLKPECPLVALPTGKSCTGKWKEVKDGKGCTSSWECAQ